MIAARPNIGGDGALSPRLSAAGQKRALLAEGRELNKRLAGTGAKKRTRLGSLPLPLIQRQINSMRTLAARPPVAVDRVLCAAVLNVVVEFVLGAQKPTGADARAAYYRDVARLSRVSRAFRIAATARQSPATTLDWVNSLVFYGLLGGQEWSIWETVKRDVLSLVMEVPSRRVHKGPRYAIRDLMLRTPFEDSTRLAPNMETQVLSRRVCDVVVPKAFPTVIEAQVALLKRRRLQRRHRRRRA